MAYSPSSEDIVIAHMTGAVPERRDEIRALWERYDPKVIVVQDAKHITLNATKDRIKFDAKTMDVFWLIGFSGWHAIECYGPHVMVSEASGQTIETIIQDDQELAEVELAYKERRAAAQTLFGAANPAVAPWPPDLPRPNASRDAFDHPQYKAAFDLTCLAVAFTLFHEFRHVMLDRDGQRPQDLREEELACDVWAREFMTAKLAAYARDHGHDYHEVLRKRSMGFALAALILHEITPVWDHGGNVSYFSVATRLQTILDNTQLQDNDPFWVFSASLLIGIFRQKGRAIITPHMNAFSLTSYLLAEL
jgi:hypothetical protein